MIDIPSLTPSQSKVLPEEFAVFSFKVGRVHQLLSSFNADIADVRERVSGMKRFVGIGFGNIASPNTFVTAFVMAAIDAPDTDCKESPFSHRSLDRC